MDDVFKALSDPTRRELLDALYERDGQTLGELEARFEMSRFGVMKHLKVLEAAHLVVSKRRGREKLHFLNTVPIRLVHDRWVSKYAEPWAATLSGLKRGIEEEKAMEKVFEVYVKATPERVWQAITDPEERMKYTFGAPPPLESTVLEEDPPNKRVEQLVAEWSDEVKAEGASRVTWELEEVGTSCRVRVTHDELKEGANEELYGGWPMILSGLKTLLETGELLDTPGSLMVARMMAEKGDAWS
jgi:DNA-binding transcriptional ArsR family regulator